MATTITTTKMSTTLMTSALNNRVSEYIWQHSCPSTVSLKPPPEKEAGRILGCLEIDRRIKSGQNKRIQADYSVKGRGHGSLN